MSNNQAPVLERVRMGMPVYDKYGQEIGEVIRIRIKDKQDEDVDAARKTTIPADDDEWLDLIADIIEPDDRRGIDLAKELWQEGYIKLGQTSLQGFRQYILPRQIKKIDEQGLHLNVSRETK